MSSASSVMPEILFFLITHNFFNSFHTDISISIKFDPLSAIFTKMVKHTQTIRRQIAGELFECVGLFL